MVEELKESAPTVEAPTKADLLKESAERSAAYKGAEVLTKGRQNLDAFASNPELWRDVEAAQTRINETENGRSTWSLVEQKRILDSGGDLLIKKGHIKHEELIPDEFGYKVPETHYEFDGTGFHASFDLDSNGNPQRNIVYEVPKDSSKPRRIELFTRSGMVEAESGSPEFDTIEKELAIEIGKGLRVAPNEKTEPEAIEEQGFGPTLKYIRNLPETTEPGHSL